MNEISITLKQAHLMKHTIGYSGERITGRVNKKYKAFRNYFATATNDSNFKDLEELCDKGLMISRQSGSTNWFFHVSKQGFEYLSKLTDIEIFDEEVSI